MKPGIACLLNKRWYYLSSLIISLLICVGCEGTHPTLPVSDPLADLYPVDGNVDFSSFADVYEETLTFRDVSNLSSIKATHLRWIVLNDDRDLYIALEWTDGTWNNGYTFEGPTDFDGIQILIDNDGNGRHETGEDKRMLIAASVGAYYMDQYASEGDGDDLIGDGFGWLRYHEELQTYQAEFLFPLTGDARGEDGDISDITRMNIILFDHIVLEVSSGNTAFLNPNLTNSRGWPKVSVYPVDPLSRESIPDGLTGLIVFISTHEDEKGEIYTFDPQSRITTRITDNDLYEENVSLSHDRTKIAFHATTDKLDYTQYEIYTINVDGSELTRLTDNTVLDGHPGWSPDDTKIAYASFRDEKASVIVMTSDGTEIADLTQPQFDDNDPDWLPDGRIVFKTDRFSALPELRIAVMDDTGDNVKQVTFMDGVVDHDPMGDMQYTVFERLMKSANYATDVTSIFTPWNIIEASLDGSEERSLVADVWINWLPVYDPSGQYIVYLKTHGYTDARLITRDGKDLGRLIPDITRLTYIDWK